MSVTAGTSAIARASVISGTTPTIEDPSHNFVRTGLLTVCSAINLYMASYSGRDSTRSSRMAWWASEIGHLTLAEIDSDHIFFAIEKLSSRSPRYWAGNDADGKPIFKAKPKPYAPATINRYVATIGALCTWCIRKRLVPKNWEHPCRGLERTAENNERVRFLSNDERIRLLKACRESKWNKLYLLVLMALTTGARRTELLTLKWKHIDADRAEAHLDRTKNGDRKVLPLVPAVVDELKKFTSAPDTLIFASDRRPVQPFNFVPRWQSALRQAKIKDFRFHDLRHSCASYLAQEGATLLEIGEVLGHRQISVTKRYSHLTTQHKTKLIHRVLGDIR